MMERCWCRYGLSEALVVAARVKAISLVLFAMVFNRDSAWLDENREMRGLDNVKFAPIRKPAFESV
jgi:hypothetical protein